MLLVSLLMLGIGIACNPKIAHATEYVPISSSDFVAKNPLTIDDITPTSPVSIVSSTTTVKTSKTTDDPNKTTYGNVLESLDAWFAWNRYENQDIDYVRKYTYSGMGGTGCMVTNRCSTGITLEFTDLTTEGDSGSVTVEYPVAGTYHNKKVGARVTYSITYSPSQWEHWWESEPRPISTSPFGYPVLCLSDSFFNGVRQLNTKQCAVAVTFFDSETKNDVSIQGGWISLNSLNYAVPTSVSGHIVTGSEQVSAPISKTSKIEYRNDGDIKIIADNGYATAFSHKKSSDFIDQLGESTFTKQTAVLYQEDSFDFTIRGTQTSAGNWKYNVWWTPASSSIANQITDNPHKTVDKNEAGPNDILTYTISQKVNTLGVDGVVAYESMAIIDSLPSEVRYVDGSARAFKVKNNATTELPSDAGSFSYDNQTNCLMYSFSNIYLKNMDLEGETYRIVFNAQLNESLSAIAENTATTLINEHELVSNTVQTLINKPVLSLEKTVDSYDQHIGKYANYTLKLSNTETGTYAKDLVIEDMSLPTALELDTSSITVSGLPEQVTVNTIKSGSVAVETLPNAYKVEPSGNAFKIAIDFLPANTEITITYCALVKESAIGTEVVNTATASASNADLVQDIEYIWVNSAKLSLDKKAHAYEWRTGDNVEYTLTLTNTQTNTIAKNITIDETSLPEGLSVNFDSIEIEAPPASLNYPTSRDETQLITNSFTVEKMETGFIASFDYLPHNSAITITFTATAQSHTNGLEVVNRAYSRCENAAPGHPNPVEAADSIWINSPELVPNKTSSNITYRVGDIVKYKIVISNEATGTVARNVTITDLFETKDVEIERTSITVFDAVGNPVTDQCEIIQNATLQGFEIRTPFTLVNPAYYSIYDKGLVEQNAPNPLNATTETELTIEYTAQIVSNELAGKEVVNQVKANSDEGPGGTDEDTVIVNGPLLKIEKSTNATMIKVGDTITYHLAISQLREGMIAKNVVIDDAYVYDGASLVEESVKIFDSRFDDITDTCQVDTANNLHIATSRDLSDEDVLYVEYQVHLSKSSEGELINTAQASADNAGRVIDKERVPVIKQAPAIVDVTKSSDPKNGTQVAAGQEVTYYLTIKNSGELPAIGIGINDRIPTNTELVELPRDHSGTYFKDSNSVSWLIEELPAGESVTVEFKVIITADVVEGSSIRNHATYAAHQTDVSEVPLENNTNTVTHPVESAVIEIIKSSSPGNGAKVTAGQEITYYLTATNKGGSCAQGVGINDIIPINTNLVELQTDHSGIYSTDNNSVGWLIEKLHIDESITVSFTVKVSDEITADSSVENYATYASNQSTPPTVALENRTNTVTHPVNVPLSSRSGSPYDKLGFDQLLPLCLIAGLGITAIISLLYALRKRLLDK